MMQPDRQDSDIIIRQFRLAAAATLVVLLVGMLFYHHFEHLNWVNDLYFCVVTLLTVGYGDITPHTTIGKLFTVVYLLTGVSILATFANLTLKRAVNRRRSNGKR